MTGDVVRQFSVMPARDSRHSREREHPPHPEGYAMFRIENEPGNEVRQSREIWNLLRVNSVWKRALRDYQLISTTTFSRNPD